MMNISRIISRSRLPPIVTQCNFSTNIEEKIEIPRRVPRSPTDILRALDSTVGRDPTAAHYKYHDDPYLIPMSNSGKRTFAMAQEAGRKAAHWVRRQHPDLFQHREADPYVEAFGPPMIYTEESDVTIEDLDTLIKTAQASDAVLVYKLLKQKNIEVTSDLELGLLELLCYQNGDDILSAEFIEEKWFRQSNRPKEKVRKTWKDGNFAEEIFINIDNKTAKAYGALIQGMAKFQQAERAWQLFEEAQQKNLALNTNTYNSVISVVNFIKESFDLRWEMTTNLLVQMKNQNLRPNLGTLNAVLHSLSSMGSANINKQNTLKVLAEFKNLGVEPSLASWFYVLQIFCKERGSVSTVLYDIMDVIQGKEHPIRDLKDTNFFVYAMENSRHHLKDVDLARRVNDLLHFGNNYNLIGDSFKESVYFRHYFALLCANLPLEEFMNDVYNTLVPHIYVPEPGIMVEVVNAVDANGAVHYIPKLWSDMISFDHHYRENLIELIVNTMVNNIQLLNDELKERFAYIGWDIYNRIEAQDEDKMYKIKATGDLFGKILILILQNKEFTKACTIMDKLDKNQHTIAGVPKIDALSLFIDQCIEEKAPSRAISCIQYCADCGFPEAKSLAVKLHEKLNLDEVLHAQLSKIIGEF